MPIPEAQLRTWSNRGATVTSAQAYSRIEAALTHRDSPIAGLDKEIYLQGSYRNSTNIYGDSDIDVVVQLNATFHRDISALAPDQLSIYRNSYRDATYQWAHFREDVITALQRQFGNPAITPSSKSIKVNLGTGRPADVIPVLHFRLYHYHWGIGPSLESFTSGIQFQDNRGRVIINYPKLHIENGETKNSRLRTNGFYKPAVRMFKNARNRLIDDDILADDAVPSYFLECLLYNVPDDAWTASLTDTYARVVNYLNAADSAQFMCQNGQVNLIGPDSTQWNVQAATSFVEELVGLWNNWY